MDMRIMNTHGVRDLTPAVMLDAAIGEPRIMDADFYRATTMPERALLGAHNALYGLPTRELVEWLSDFIGDRSAIEIGAGHGALAKAVGIPATDNWMQDDPAIRAVYEMSGQKPVQYGTNVEKIGALPAIEKYRPQVVIASWVTHLWTEDRPEAGGNMFGVAEELVVDAVEAYVMIGNTHVHRNKAIWDRPHTLIHPDWLFSRAHNGSPEFIAVWGK